MPPTSRLPHWVQILLAIVAICVPAVLTANGHGDIALPAAVVALLQIVSTVLGLTHDSWKSVTLARRAMLQRRRDSLGYAPVHVLFAVVGVGGLGILCIGASCQETVKDVTIGLNAAICVLNTVASEEAAGKSEAAAIEGAAVTCLVTTAQAAGVLAAHRKALVLEGYAKTGGSK